MNWSPDRSGSAITLAAAGLTQSEIAQKLGHGITRTEVMNYLYRIGASTTPPPMRYSEIDADDPTHARKPSRARVMPSLPSVPKPREPRTA